MFVDNIAVQVVEEQLVEHLPNLLSPPAIQKMAPHLISKISAESTADQVRRQELKRVLKILGESIETCSMFFAGASISMFIPFFSLLKPTCNDANLKPQPLQRRESGVMNKRAGKQLWEFMDRSTLHLLWTLLWTGGLQEFHSVRSSFSINYALRVWLKLSYTLKWKDIALPNQNCIIECNTGSPRQYAYVKGNADLCSLFLKTEYIHEASEMNVKAVN